MPNGVQYHGEMRDKFAPHGKGTMVLPTSETLHGIWNNGQPFQGNAQVTYKDGKVYTGSFVNGERNGQGKLDFPSGKSWHGIWKSNVFYSGSGEIKYGDNAYCVGNFSDGVPHGQARCHWRDGTKYEGNFERGVINGIGEAVWNRGIKYKGSWLNGYPHGQGFYADKIMSFNGEFEKGNLINSKVHIKALPLSILKYVKK